MTKGMSATLAIAVLLIVGSIMEEGGPVDNLAKNAEGQSRASADEAGESETDVIVATAQAPATQGPEQDVWSWFGEAEEEPAHLSSRPPATRQPTKPVTITGNGELDRHRMNLEG